MMVMSTCFGGGKLCWHNAPNVRTDRPVVQGAGRDGCNAVLVQDERMWWIGAFGLWRAPFERNIYRSTTRRS